MARILVVDDNELVLSTISELLRDMRHNAFPAQSAEEALSLMQAETEFDLIVTDVVMPGMDGREFAKHILSDPGDQKRSCDSDIRPGERERGCEDSGYGRRVFPGQADSHAAVSGGGGVRACRR